MSHVISDFLPGSLREVKRNNGVRPYGQGPTLDIAKRGTLIWHMEDDVGKKHRILIPNSIYVPDGTMRLLSPQHWAKEAMKAGSNPEFTFSTQMWNRNILTWGTKGQFKKIVYCDRLTWEQTLSCLRQ